MIKNETESRGIHAVVFGRVQGVFYRANTQKIAKKLGINGWIRNRDDGTVELVAVGTEDSIEELIAWLAKGPPMARVSNIQLEDFYGESYTSFEVIE